jgi:hypothetical protein
MQGLWSKSLKHPGIDQSELIALLKKKLEAQMMSADRE